MAEPLPHRLVAFYGDDFTGSAAVMEVLAAAGLDTALFVSPPTPERLADFADKRAIGIAGDARARGPDWMRQNLPPIFALLRGTGAPIVHYKICSTLDSSPTIGSIGAAIDAVWDVVADGAPLWAPLVVAAPPIGRYQAFGNLFAVLDGEGWRLDRHPVMSVHPSTPMDEADVRLHLGKQTARAIGLVDFLAMKAGRGDERLLRERARGADIVALDVLDAETLSEAGRLIWKHGAPRVLAVGSQGVEEALLAYWRAAKLAPPAPEPASATAHDRIAAVSGSASAVTARQIDWACANGFEGVTIDAEACLDTPRWEGEIARVEAACLRALEHGASPLAYTAHGPDDDALARLKARVKAGEADAAAVTERLGAGLGCVLRTLVDKRAVRRCAIAGGDTSGFATRALGVDALSFIAPIAPGAGLCLGHRGGDTIEISLKGGQMGPETYFGAVRAGRKLEA